jgi:hypothetical protein
LVDDPKQPALLYTLGHGDENQIKNQTRFLFPEKIGKVWIKEEKNFLLTIRALESDKKFYFDAKNLVFVDPKTLTPPKTP